MCNRLHQSEKVVDHLREQGVLVDVDRTWRLPPGELFPSSMKTPRNAIIVRRQRDGNRPLVAEIRAWGIPCQVNGARPGTTLTKLVTNVRNYRFRLWAPLIADPASRCLVPFTHFAEPHPAGGKGDDGLPRQAWFSQPGEPVGMFAGVMAQGPHGPAFAFLTTAANDQMRPIHEQAMPVIVARSDWSAWLDGSAQEARDLARPYAGPLTMQIETPPLSAPTAQLPLDARPR